LTKARIPYIVSPNGTAAVIERRFVAKRIFDFVTGREMLDWSATILAASNAERKQLLDLGLPNPKIHVIPNPIDETEYEQAADPARFRRTVGLPTESIVLFLGKLTPRKGVDVLLHAFRRVSPAAHLVIAGNDMGAGADVRRIIAKFDLHRRVTQVGLLKGAHRLDALAAATVVAYPSRDEVFGLVAVEALLCGSPVIVGDDSGCGEVIAEVGGGVSVPYGNVAALARALTIVLDAAEPWRARARAAGLDVRQRFGSSRVCAELEAAYQEVA
jgi:glycosyltransferase involved in cell wall biosynthesis